MSTVQAGRTLASVVIPAHNEERTIGRTLTRLLTEARPGELDVVVVCNGCTDATADRARAVDTSVRVLEIEIPSKAAAVAAGNEAARVFPRVHLDADVEVGAADVRALVTALSGRVLAVGPQRLIPRDGCSPWVRWYYDVWEELPQVRAGLFGRGVIALSAEGQERVDRLPRVMSDDLAISEAFGPDELAVVGSATVVVRPPRTTSDLLRRRVRIATGNAQADSLGVRSPASATSPRVLARMALERPRLIARVPVFLAVTLVARKRARASVRSNDFTTWQRDESSRIEAG